MGKKVLSLFFVFVLTLGVLPANLNLVSAKTIEDGKEEYLVMLNGPAEKGVFKAFDVEDSEIIHEFDFLPLFNIKLTSQQAKGLANNPQIKFIEENEKVQLIEPIEISNMVQEIPWGVERVEALEAHRNGVTGKGVDVAIIDTGIDRNHPDLKDNVQDNSFSAYSSNPADAFNDGNGHGTHVSGTVAASGQILGVAPDANLYAVKVLDSFGSGYLSDVVEGVEWAIDNEVDIISMSLGSSSSFLSLEEAVNTAYDAGILVVAAAGNSYAGTDTVGYPAKYDSVIAVAATDEQNIRASFSSTGPAVEISGPGVGVRSTYSGGYASLSGTSMAAPHVAGSAALLWEDNPDLSNAELRELLRNTAKNLGTSHEYGYGLVQVMDALSSKYLVATKKLIQ